MNAPSDQNPIDAQEQQLMAERAKELAEPPPSEAEHEIFARVSIVKVGNERFGLPVQSLCEIMASPPITAVPGLPAWMPGVAKTREGVVCVINLGLWFGVTGLPATMPYLALLEGKPGRLALGVHSGGGIAQVTADQIANELTKGADHYGLPILATTKDLLTILDTTRLFEMSEIRIGAQRLLAKRCS